MKYINATISETPEGPYESESISVDLFAFGKMVGTVEIYVHGDDTDKNKQYLVTWHDQDFEDPMILREGHITEGVIQYAEKQDRTLAEG